MSERGRATVWCGVPVETLATRWNVPALEAWEVIDSTNARLRERDPLPADWTTVVASRQTRGRGRNGKSWVSAREGVALSFVFRPGSAREARLVPLRVGLGVVEALEEAEGIRADLKWPNDVAVDGRKVAGILCEGGSGGLVVGIGVNLAGPPEVSGPRSLPTGGLAELRGRYVDPVRVAEAVLVRVRRRLDMGEVRLLEEELQSLEARDALRGREVEVTPGPRGIARGIAEDGALRVETVEGVVRVVSGSVRLSGRDARPSEFTEGEGAQG